MDPSVHGPFNCCAVSQLCLAADPQSVFGMFIPPPLSHRHQAALRNRRLLPHHAVTILSAWDSFRVDYGSFDFKDGVDA